jgi:hypothetical protein
MQGGTMNDKKPTLEQLKQSNATKVKLAVIASLVTLYAIYMGSSQLGLSFDKFIMLLLEK